MSAAVEWLLGSPPVAFAEGEVTLAAPWVVYGAAVALTAVSVWLLLGYRVPPRRLSSARRLLLAALRTAAFAVLLLCLFQPTLVLSLVVPQENFVGVLLDDSASMRIRDEAGGEASRAELLLAAFAEDPAGAADALGPALRETFVVRYLRFADSAGPVATPAELRFAGERTDLAAALSGAADRLGSQPLAGLVLLTDGAGEDAGEGLDEVLLDLRARGIRVFPVPLGSPRFDVDLEVGALDAPDRVLRGSLLEVRIPIRARGLGGQVARVEVLDEGRIASVETVRFDQDDVETAITVLAPTEEAGPRRFRVRVAPAPGETVTRNNERTALLHVEERVVPILYFEGQPRWEFKYVRRAVHGDGQLRVAGLVRTAEGKFYRVEVTDEQELAGGFPDTREELFRYAGVILGSVEASFFTQDQLNMLRDLVSRRGGGLLTLGSGKSYHAGGYRGTPIAEILPLALTGADGGTEAPDGSSSGPSVAERNFRQLAIAPTRAGRTHPVVRLDQDPLVNQDRYRTLPLLSSVNLTAAPKPGAVTLLEGVGADGTREPVFLTQRFGRGRAASLTVQDLWLWQMGAEVAVDDPTHEQFWRRLLRWLAAEAPRRLEVAVDPSRPSPGEAVTIRARVEDASFLAVNDVVVEAAVTRPDGVVEAVPLLWGGQADGEYVGSVVVETAGIHAIEARAGGAGFADRSEREPASAFFEAGPPDDEYFNAESNRELLERIARETGGALIAREEADNLVERLSLSRSGATVIERRELWNAPLLFLLLFGFLGVEWALRAMGGLP